MTSVNYCLAYVFRARLLLKIVSLYRSDHVCHSYRNFLFYGEMSKFAARVTTYFNMSKRC